MLRQLFSPLLFFAVAVAVAVHQWIYWDVWFEVKDIHHELFISMFVFAGIVLAVYRRRLI